MFIGHFALGFAAKRVAPRLNLVVLFAAAQFADVLWPLLVALGVEDVRIRPGDTAFTPLEFVSYPWSHSLLALAIWGALFGLLTRDRAHPRRLWLIAGLVVSHWVLDVATHRADMPLYPGGPKLGFGLWNSVPATIATESAMFTGGVWIYLQCTRARDAIGRWAAVGLVALLVAAYAANIASGPPPSVQALVAAAAIGTVATIVLTWWADRHRESTCRTR